METRRIAPLARADVHRISGAQVVLDLRAVVKELVENALDAGATSIEVRFKEHGRDLIEVADNGSGIARADYATLALPHHTSKLAAFEQLCEVSTFGFRGEALAALCSLADVSVHTATAEEAPMGTVLEYAHDGTLREERKAARTRGTTVTVTQLFAHLPVRRRELEKNIKREYAKAHAILQAYALISRGVRWNSTLTSSGGRRQTQLVVQSGNAESYLRTNVTALFGAKAAAALMPLSLDVQLPKPDPFSDALTVGVRGLVSKPSSGSGRSSGDRQFFYLNGRPWENAKLARVFNEVYHGYNMAQVPCVVVDVQVRTDAYDVNVSPDKRTLFMHQEAAMLEALRAALDAAYAPSRGVFHVGNEPPQAKLAFGAAPQTDVPAEPAEPPAASAAEPAERPEQEPPATSTAEPAASPPVLGKRSEPPASSSPPRKAPAVSDSPVSSSPARRVSQETRSGSDAVSTLSASWSSRLYPETAPSQSSELDELDSGSSEPRTRSRSSPGHGLQSQFRRAVEKFAMVSQGSTADEDEADEGAFEDELASEDMPRTDSTAPEHEPSDDELDAEEQGPTGDGPVNYVTETSAEGLEYHEDGDEGDEAEEDEGENEKEKESEQAEEEDKAAEEAGDDQEALAAQAETFAPRNDMVEAESRAASESEPGATAVGEEVTAATEREASGAAPLDADTAGPVPGAAVPTLRIPWERLQQKARAPGAADSSAAVALGPSALESAGVDQSMEQAAETLERVIQKTDFAQMQVVGQFNLGFILARRRLGTQDDLFIIDQHAADEKFNFETLQRETRLHSQPLIQPQTVELAPTDELVAADHLAWLQANGFDVRVDEGAPPGSRIQLLAKPVSRSTVFNLDDLAELLHLLRDAPERKHARCSKVRDLLASRACRKSIMVGAALDMRRMQVVVHHLGEIDQPWVRYHRMRRTSTDITELSARTPDDAPPSGPRRHAARRAAGARALDATRRAIEIDRRRRRPPVVRAARQPIPIDTHPTWHDSTVFVEARHSTSRSLPATAGRSTSACYGQRAAQRAGCACGCAYAAGMAGPT